MAREAEPRAESAHPEVEKRGKSYQGNNGEQKPDIVRAPLARPAGESPASQLGGGRCRSPA